MFHSSKSPQTLLIKWSQSQFLNKLASIMGFLTKTRGQDLPWLMLPYQHKKGNKYFKSFFSISSNKIHYLELQAARGKTICGSSKGWLIMVDETSEVTLINPLTEAQIQLPRISHSLDQTQYALDSPKSQRFFVHKAILSLAPASTPDEYVVMVIYGETRELAYYKSGTEAWTTLQEAGSFYDDVISHWGELYAVNKYGKVVVCDLESYPIVKEIAKPWVLRGNKVYLVGIGGELCLVIRKLKDNPDIGYETCDFKVHRLVSYEQWKPIKNLGHWMLFLGHNHSQSLPANTIKGFRGNCIYFMDDNMDTRKNGVIGGHDSGVFSLEDRSIQPLHCCPGDLQYVWPRPIWFTPDS